VRRGKVVLSKVRGDVNPADVLTKPKSLEDMKVLLNFSCLDWCDGKVGENTCRDNRIEFVNSVGNRNTCRDSRIEFVNSVGSGSFEDSGNANRYCFVNSPTVRRRNSSFEDTGNVGRYYFVNSPTVRRRGGVGVRTVCFGPNPANPNICRCQHGPSRRHVGHIESGRIWG